MIPYGKQDINQADVDSILSVLKSDFLTQGPQVPAFEKIISKYCKAKYGVATNSATSSLHIACLALGLGKDDWLWTSPNSFVASANCGLYCGASVDFVDIDPKTYNLSIHELKKKLTQAKKENKLPKIIIPVHFGGQSCDMKEIHALSQEYNFKIIEDASHAIGGKYLDLPIGCYKYSDVTVFSFHPVKIITTAEGGIATTNDENLSERMRLFRSHGVTRDPNLMTNQSNESWYYEQVDIGFNYRMTDLQAALGISQMKRLDEFVAKRHTLSMKYDELLQDLPIILPHQHNYNYSAFHLYPIQIDLKNIGKDRKQIFNELRQNGIGVNVHYIPIHTQPFYRKLGFQLGDFPNSEAYYNRSISIPLFYAMTFEQQKKVCFELKRIFK